jgi:ElaB/YqjD/DUF883 family membrane-anchored ribosome-binding protein
MTTSTSDASTGRLQEAASGVAEEAGRTAEVTASKTMDRAADALDQLCQSMRGASSELRESQPQLAGVVDTAVEQVDKAANYLRQHEPREIMDTVQDTARQQPALVIGGGLAIGLVLGRLLRSASSGQGSQYRGSGYGFQGGYGSGYQGGYGSGYQGGGYGSGYQGGGYGAGMGTEYRTPGYGGTGAGQDLGGPADAYGTGGQGYGTGYGTRSDSDALTSSDVGDPNATIMASGTAVEAGSEMESGYDTSADTTEFTDERR